PSEEVRAMLAEAISANLVGRRESSTGPIYMFEHALIAEAVTETMLKSQRRRFHGRIAEILASGELSLEDAAPERIARHFEAAARPLDAIEWYNAAAR